MSVAKWFLPDEPDVIGLLRAQLAITIGGLEDFALWAGGDQEAGARLRAAEVRADDAKRDLREALRSSFVTPVDPEDVYALSRGVDWMLDHARDVLTESEVMQAPPDLGIARMADLLAEGSRDIDRAIADLASDPDEAAAAADAALNAERRLERTYYDGMAALLAVEDMRLRISRRELYRRCARIGETLVDVAERVIYAVVKES